MKKKLEDFENNTKLNGEKLKRRKGVNWSWLIKMTQKKL
jgi:hypothetical protein